MSMDAQPHAGRPHVDLRLVAVVGLVVLVVLLALSVWALARGGESRSPDEVLVDEVFAALNAKDDEAIGRLFTEDAVVTFGRDDPGIVGMERLKEAVGAASLVTRVGDTTTLVDPPGGFSRPNEIVDQHYVVVPVLIHDDPFVVVFDVRGGKVATEMIFEPFEPTRS
jgi:ketosteroid isomerase-like protein